MAIGRTIKDGKQQRAPDALIVGPLASRSSRYTVMRTSKTSRIQLKA
jgi:hypothetical protein